MLEQLLSKEVIAPILIILFSILTYKIITKIVRKVFLFKLKRVNEGRQKTFVSLVNNLIKYIIFFIALMMVLEIYGIDTSSLLVSLGGASVIAGLAFQDLLKDIISGFGIILEDQYSVGDVVNINGFTGTVKELGLKTTRLRAFTGETRIISNRNITEVTNYTIHSNNQLIDVQVSYDSDLRRVKEIIDEVCADFTETEKLISKAECFGVEDLGESGITFRVSIPAKYSDKFALARKFRMLIKERFDREGIEIPFPQLVVHNHE